MKIGEGAEQSATEARGLRKIVHIDMDAFIWPIQLGFMDNARVVTGWCELRHAFRFFRTDRISSAEIGDRYSARRADLIRDFHSQLRDEDGTEKSPDRN